MEDKSFSFADPDKSLIIWDFIEGGRNADQYEQQLTEVTNRNLQRDGFIIRSNINSNQIKIKKKFDITLDEVIKQHFKEIAHTHDCRILRNGRLLKRTQKLNEFDPGSTIQLFFVKKQKEDIPEEKSEMQGSDKNSIESKEDENQNDSVIDLDSVIEDQLELGFNYFDAHLSVS